jgi:hypothetical protein
MFYPELKKGLIEERAIRDIFGVATSLVISMPLAEPKKYRDGAGYVMR